ncbi:MAG: PQQ-binding-like beta-propeller repeat protein [Chloroherpetonaceae bacterium]|nr:PQQ-like beta-propeller repeat protein [Chthonomonadaceae bacterium]MDW8208528.1 PQQ-binding-like beta-propeller repeat protein [Chloroherpetonaceae bacterium]
MRTRWAVIVSFFCLYALTAQVAPAQDWPQWRGPGRDGISREKDLLPSWPPEGPRLLWQVNDAGFGYGSVAVAGNRVYLVGNKGLDNEFVTALDARDGRVLWTTRIGKVGNPNQRPSYPGARSTPTVDGDLVYAFGSDGDLACLEARTGKIRWQKNVRTELGGKPGEWAYAESPLVDGNRVIVTPGGEQATLVAFNKKTGAVIWKSAVPGGDTAGYASAQVIEIGGIRQIVQYLSKGLVGVDAKTGQFLWRFDKTVDTRFGVSAATPIVAGDSIYTAAATGGGVARLRASGGTVTAEAVYVERKIPNTIGGAVKVGDYLYGTTSAVLLCTEYATGKVLWEDRSVGPASLCYADGRLYVHGENGEVALVEATPEGYRERGRFTPPNPPERGQSRAWSYPAIAGGRLYIRQLGTLWVFDLRASRAAR